LNTSQRTVQPNAKPWWTKKPKLMKRIKKGGTYRYHVSHDSDPLTAQRLVYGDIHPGLKKGCPVCLRERVKKKAS
jgi:hypothetical protein